MQRFWWSAFDSVSLSVKALNRGWAGFLVVALTSSTAALTGCAAHVSSSASPTPLESTRVDQFTGRSLADALARVEIDRALIYDLSKPVLDIEPSYEPTGEDDRWLVIANCSAANGIGLGVIPRRDAGPEIRAKVRTRGYNSMLTECTNQEDPSWDPKTPASPEP